MKDRIRIRVNVQIQIYILNKVMLVPVIRNTGTGSMKQVWHATGSTVTEKLEVFSGGH